MENDKYVCVWERECVCVMCVWVCVYVCVYVCVCVRERERYVGLKKERKLKK